MALTDDQLVELRTELDTDPESLGYAGTIGNDPACAALLNEVGLSGETIKNTTALKDDILDAVVVNELASVPVNELQFFLTRFANGQDVIDISDGSAAVVQIGQTFAGSAPDTLAALIALQTRSASRAEVLFGANVVITHLDVGKARLL